MQEYRALHANKTWVLVPRPRSVNVMTGKSIFHHKLNSDDSLDWYKACRVVRGFSQKPSIGFDETFNPLVKPTMIRTVLSFAVSQCWPMHLLDVKNAFLHGVLNEKVYCQQPTGFVDSSHPDHVCLLSKSLYG